MNIKRTGSIPTLPERLLLQGNKIKIVPTKELCCRISWELEYGYIYICMHGFSIYRNTKDDILALSREMNLDGIHNQTGTLKAFIPYRIYITTRPDDWMMLLLLILKEKRLIRLHMSYRITADETYIPLPPSFLEKFIEKVTNKLVTTRLLEQGGKESIEVWQCVEEGYYAYLKRRYEDIPIPSLQLDIG